MKIKIFFLILILAKTMFLSHAGTIRDDVSDERYLDYGNQHECVLKLSYFKNKEIRYGSCVAISKQHVVTAAHMVTEAETVFVDYKDRCILVKRIFIFPKYDGTFKTPDVAVCELKEPISLDFYPSLYSEKKEINKVCSICGYGKTGKGSTGAHKDSLEKRAGSNKINKTDRYNLYCTMDKYDTTELEYLHSFGDSGGGLFIDGKLAGINSGVVSKDGNPDSSYGDISFHTRISEKECRNWIMETISTPMEK